MIAIVFLVLTVCTACIPCSSNGEVCDRFPREYYNGFSLRQDKFEWMKREEVCPIDVLPMDLYFGKRIEDNSRNNRESDFSPTIKFDEHYISSLVVLLAIGILISIASLVICASKITISKCKNKEIPEMIPSPQSEEENQFQLLLSENSDLKNRIRDLEIRMNIVEKDDCRDVIVIFGIPNLKYENVKGQVCMIGAALGINVEMSDIAFALRDDTLPALDYPEEPQPIIARFTRQNIAADFLLAAQNRVDFSLNDIYLIFPYNRNVFVLPSMSDYNRKLLAKALILKRKGKLSGVRVINLCVYAQVSEQSEFIPLFTKEDLKEMVYDE